MIDGVTVTPRRQIVDERGRVMKFLSTDDEAFRGFGEVYFSGVDEGVIKGWNRHSRMWLNWVCVAGRVKVVLFDGREDGPTAGEVAEVTLGRDEESEYALLTIPPGIWASFKGLAPGLSLLANCASIVHDPGEYERVAIDDPRIPYVWGGE